MKTCSTCRMQKPVATFSRNRAAKDGRQSRCKPCDAKVNRAWQAANPDKVLNNVMRRYWRERRAAGGPFDRARSSPPLTPKN